MLFKLGVLKLSDYKIDRGHHHGRHQSSRRCTAVPLFRPSHQHPPHRQLLPRTTNHIEENDPNIIIQSHSNRVPSNTCFDKLKHWKNKGAGRIRCNSYKTFWNERLEMLIVIWHWHGCKPDAIKVKQRSQPFVLGRELVLRASICGKPGLSMKNQGEI